MIRWWLAPVEFVPEGGKGRGSHNPVIARHTAQLDLASIYDTSEDPPSSRYRCDDSDRCLLNQPYVTLISVVPQFNP